MIAAICIVLSLFSVSLFAWQVTRFERRVRVLERQWSGTVMKVWSDRPEGTCVLNMTFEQLLIIGSHFGESTFEIRDGVLYVQGMRVSQSPWKAEGAQP